MNIQALIQTQPDAIQTLFDAYGINKPVNVDTVSAAIVLYKNPEGNTFLEDLAALAADNENNYEDFTLRPSQEKKDAAAARRAEKGGSTAGKIIRTVVPVTNAINIKKRGGIQNTAAGKLFNKIAPLGKKSPTQAITNNNILAAPLTDTASVAAVDEPIPGGDITPKQPGSKVSDIINAAGQAASGIADAIDTIRNGNDTDDQAPNDTTNQNQTGWKKYMPFIIGGAALVVVGVVIYFVSRKK